MNSRDLPAFDVDPLILGRRRAGAVNHAYVIEYEHARILTDIGFESVRRLRDLSDQLFGRATLLEALLGRPEAKRFS